MCGINDYPKMEGLCFVASVAGLANLFVGDKATVAICLLGIMVGQILLFGDRLDRQRRAFKDQE